MSVSIDMTRGFYDAPCFRTELLLPWMVGNPFVIIHDTWAGAAEMAAGDLVEFLGLDETYLPKEGVGFWRVVTPLGDVSIQRFRSYGEMIRICKS